MPGTYNQSITVFDGSQETASTTLQIIVHAPLRIEAPSAPWMIRGVATSDSSWSVLGNGSVTVFRGDLALSAELLNRKFLFAACTWEPVETLRVYTDPSGLIHYGGYGRATYTISLFDTSENGPADYVCCPPPSSSRALSNNFSMRFIHSFIHSLVVLWSFFLSRCVWLM